MASDSSDLITIQGLSGTHSLKEVGPTVVKIGKLYYLRHDPTLVKIPNGLGKLRFFRKDSPYLVTLHNGQQIHKENAILTEDKIYFERGSSDIVKVNNKWVRKAYCVQIGNEWLLKTDSRLSRCAITGIWDFTENLILLSEKYYGKNYRVHKSNESSCVITNDKEFVFAKNCQRILNPETGIPEYYHTQSKEYSKIKNSLGNIFFEFQDKTNPQEDRVIQILAPLTNDAVQKYYTEMDFTNGNGPRYYVHNNFVPHVKTCINDFIMPRLSSKMEEVREKINKNFSDLDSNENVAKSFSVVPKNWPGKADIYTPSSAHGTLKAKTFRFTGGLKYSFGGEFETSQGLLSNDKIAELGIRAVGDRSIGSAEYVTIPMQGDEGIERLKLICEALNKKTLVDDRCGLHFHIGGLNKEQRPSFTKEFIKNAINLGCILEEELYSCMPPNRTPTLYHCHSIRRFGPVTKDNFNERVGAFIFGQKEKWITEKGEPTKLFDFKQYALNENRNSHAHIGQWADGRYKWLNLIHAFLDEGHHTLEFRIFPGTTVFDKVYAYLLFSMAFTDALDNHQSLIRKGTTIEDLFAEVYAKYPSVRDFATEFFANRKKKFKRKNIYPDVPTLTFLK